MTHTIMLSEAFQLVENGSPKKKLVTNRPTGGGGKSHVPADKGKDGNKKSESDKKAPICLYAPHKAKGYRHFLKDCTACPDAEKDLLFRQLAAEKAATGPSRSTRSQKGAEDKKAAVTGSLNPPHDQPTYPTLNVTFCDGSESMTESGRADEGSDETIISARIAESATFNGIGKMAKITPVTLQVALKQEAEAERFSFSRTWTAPRTVLQVSAGPLAMVNVTYLVAYADLAVEGFLIGSPVLQNLGVNTKTFLEERRDLFDVADCSAVKSLGARGGKVSRLMIARIQGVSNDDVEPILQSTGGRPPVDYYTVRDEPDPFPDESLLDRVDSDQHEEVEESI